MQVTDTSLYHQNRAIQYDTYTVEDKFFLRHPSKIWYFMRQLISPSVFFLNLILPCTNTNQWRNLFNDSSNDRGCNDTTELDRVTWIINGYVNDEFRIICRCKTNKRYDVVTVFIMTVSTFCAVPVFPPTRRPSVKALRPVPFATTDSSASLTCAEASSLMTRLFSSGSNECRQSLPYHPLFS